MEHHVLMECSTQVSICRQCVWKGTTVLEVSPVEQRLPSGLLIEWNLDWFYVTGLPICCAHVQQLLYVKGGMLASGDRSWGEC